jgi:bifunctional DNA-binding transcriptional regulator/antitoxin component of YhaV-PrlF toxin-antitoxin module
MTEYKSYDREIKDRGQLTIPKKIRKTGRIGEGGWVTIIPAGEALIILPKRFDLDEARARIRKILKESGLTVGDIIESLDEDREAVYNATYGGKRR